MKILVTGAAGFIGSHLCERLVKDHYNVIGLDAFIPYYPREIKERNILNLKKSDNFTFIEADLRTASLKELLEGVSIIVHAAAMPGLMKSWTDLELYTSCNILGTQRLLQAAKNVGIKKFVYVSSSSIYGKFATGSESVIAQPVSPYGITKLAAEYLCQAYNEYFDVPVTMLRYFSIFGPRQRPDMVYHIFIRDIMLGNPIYIYGDGEQVRSNTYIKDCIAGTILAIEKGGVGEIYNIGGGQNISVNDLRKMIEKILGKKAKFEYKPPRPGDQRTTIADFSKAKRELGYEPKYSIEEGLKRQIEWQKEIYL